MLKSHRDFYMRFFPLILIAVFSTVAFVYFKSEDKLVDTSGKKTIVFSSHGKPFSYDPVKSDIGSNFFPSHMIFSRPLEVSPDSKLTSDILEAFNYSPENRTANLIVRKDISFSDGSPITAEDVAFSIARGVASYPTMPTVRHIEGLAAWIKTAVPLKSFPSGISFSGQIVSIKYSQAVNYPLFRFTIPIFGIIPRRCVNPETNEFHCSPLVTSGRYTIKSEDDSSLVFEPRQQYKRTSGEIKFDFLPVKEALEKYRDEKNVVIHTFYFKNESELLQTKDAERWKLRILPKSRIVGIVINPKVPPFDEIICRQVFADLYRKAIDSDLIPSSRESSFWPAIGTGYIPNLKLGKRRSYSEKDLEDCTRKIAKFAPKMGIAPDLRMIPEMKDLLTRLGFLSNPIEFKTKIDAFMAFSNQEIAFTAFATGFWPIDPYGDAEILFSENLNPLAWTVHDDTVLHSIVGQFSLFAPPSERSSEATKLNEHIFDQAVFNVYSHNSYALISTNEAILKRHQETVSDPMPWQLFD